MLNPLKYMFCEEEIFLGEIDQIAEILHGYKQDPRYLLAILLDIQAKEKYLSPSAMSRTAEYLGVPEGRVYAVATFYSTLSLKKKGRSVIRVCGGTACHLRGSAAVMAEFERLLGIKEGETTADGRFTLETVYCLGCCALAPSAVCGGRLCAQMTPAKAAEVLAREAAL